VALITIILEFLLALTLAEIDEHRASHRKGLTDFAQGGIIIWRRWGVICRRVVVTWGQSPAYCTTDNPSGKEPSITTISLGLFM
jgi:hypothetical protein